MDDKTAIIIRAITGLMIGFYEWLYYTGRLGYTDDKERKRLDKVTKYKWLYILSIILLIGGSSILLLNNLW
ncbi:MAG: hypothetical protein AAGU32_11155 [Bacillota bacterium]